MTLLSPQNTTIVVERTATQTVVVGNAAPRVINVITAGPQGPPGQSFQLSGSVANYASLPSLTTAQAGQAWLTNNDGRVYIWSGTAWPAEGTAPVLQGPPGADGKPGQIRFTGHGAPGTIIGASPNDCYLDLDSGLIYQLT